MQIKFASQYWIYFCNKKSIENKEVKLPLSLNWANPKIDIWNRKH